LLPSARNLWQAATYFPVFGHRRNYVKEHEGAD
jgi:hypothetical protein